MNAKQQRHSEGLMLHRESGEQYVYACGAQQGVQLIPV
jgi:hypothetical protein